MGDTEDPGTACRMSSALPCTLLLYTLAVAGCHNDSATSGGEPTGNVAPAGSASASPIRSATEVGDGIAPAASASGGDEAAAPTSDGGGALVLVMGPGRQGKMSTSFSGVYVCSGSELTLSTHGNIVKGTLAARRDPTTSKHGEVTCIVGGSRCEGRAVDFSIGGGPPNSQMTFELEKGGITWEAGGGVGGYCARK